LSLIVKNVSNLGKYMKTLIIMKSIAIFVERIIHQQLRSQLVIHVINQTKPSWTFSPFEILAYEPMLVIDIPLINTHCQIAIRRN